jgi:hypothetical protein
MNPLPNANADEAISKGMQSSHLNDVQNMDGQILNSSEGELVPDLLLSLTNSNENTNSKEEEAVPGNSNTASQIHDTPSNEKETPTRQTPSNAARRSNTQLNLQSISFSSEDDSDNVSAVTTPEALLNIGNDHGGTVDIQNVDEESSEGENLGSKDDKRIAKVKELILKRDWEGVSSKAESFEFEEIDGGSETSMSEITYVEGRESYEPNFGLIERLNQAVKTGDWAAVAVLSSELKKEL